MLGKMHACVVSVYQALKKIESLGMRLEQVIEKERRKQAKASERHKKRVSLVMKDGSRK